MKKNTKRITADLPAELLEDAMEATGSGEAETLIEGLKLIRRAYVTALINELGGGVAPELMSERDLDERDI